MKQKTTVAKKATNSHKPAIIAKARQTPKANKLQKTRISKTKALEAMAKSGGRFFGATFTKKDGTERTITCKFVDSTPLGYIKVSEHNIEKPGQIRNINLQTLKSLRIGGKLCTVAQ